MSKYTTEVRFICEEKAGLLNSVGVADVNEVLNLSWDKIFDNEFPIFDENYRKPLCKKILKHYYTREICAETYGLWKLWLNEKMELIMPYYNQLYENALLEIDPFKNYKYDEIGNNTKNDDTAYSENQSVTASETGSSNGSTNENVADTVWDKYSDTPQGSIQNIDNSSYLTYARNVTDGKQTTNQTATQTANTRNDSATKQAMTDFDSASQYAKHVEGMIGINNIPKIIKEFRETFLNIDEMIINELTDLFFNLW